MLNAYSLQLASRSAFFGGLWRLWFLKITCFFFAFCFCVASIILPPIIIFCPAIWAALVLCAGRYVGRSFLIFFSLSGIGLSFIGSFSLFVFKITQFGAAPLFFSIKAGSWVDWLNFSSSFGTLGWVFDDLSLSMLILVSSVSLVVHIYSVNYMWMDPGLVKFLAYLSLFSFFMFFLASASNFIQFFFGWEGVGLMSYLLVGFWDSRQQASKSAWKAVYTNRVGDFFLLLGVVILYMCFRTFDFFDIFLLNYLNSFEISRYFDLGILSIVSSSYDGQLSFALEIFNFFSPLLVTYLYVEVAILLFFLSAAAKSAQLGLHAWLPDAMEGPTPVSALIHAATMVTAGVYLLLRCAPLLCCSTFFVYYAAFFGAITCVYAGLLACVQQDAKKLIAYSTMSQLGYMVLGCCTSAFGSAFFHLWIHGYVKALLFLGIGFIIHFFQDEQSMLRFGGTSLIGSFFFLALFVGSVSLMALPFFSGYYSKEPLIEIPLFAPGFGLGFFVYLFEVAGSFFTGFYSFKLLSLVFLKLPEMSRGLLRRVFHGHYEPYSSLWVYLPLSFLIMASLFFGYCFVYVVCGSGGSYLLSVSSFSSMPDFMFSQIMAFCSEDLAGSRDSLLFNTFYTIYWFLQPLLDLSSLVIKANFFSSPLFYAVGGFLTSSALYYFNIWNFSFIRDVSRKLYFDKVVNFFVARRILLTSYVTLWQAIDKGFLEYFGPSGLVRLFLKLNRLFMFSSYRSISFFLASIVWASAILFFLLVTLGVA